MRYEIIFSNFSLVECAGPAQTGLTDNDQLADCPGVGTGRHSTLISPLLCSHPGWVGTSYCISYLSNNITPNNFIERENLPGPGQK